MIFPSEIFLVLFLPVVLSVHCWLLRRHRAAQNAFLCLFSVLFYAWGEPFVVFIMLGSVVYNWAMALWLAVTSRGRLWVLVAAIVGNVGVLVTFKYLAFIVGNVNCLCGTDFPVPQIKLPIGISFFTFQALSYVIDVSRGVVKAQRDVLNVALYISLFPQLVAGPIVRYSTISREIENRHLNWLDFGSGVRRFVIGLAKKTYLADRLATLADFYFDAGDAISGLPVCGLWLGAVAYSLQILFDFSGYSDMAIGIGRMLGFHFEENFNSPYLSKSIAEFWRRWHISLGGWFRDYVYIPLGGNRVGRLRLLLNLLVVWLLTGLWHGAGWTFLLWGLGWFVLLTFEKFSRLFRFVSRFGWLAHAYTLVCVVLLWVVFRAEGFDCALSYYRGLFGGSDNAFWDSAVLEQLRGYGVWFLLAIGTCFGVRWPLPRVVRFLGLGFLFVLSLASVVNSAYCPFIYFNF